MVFGDRQLAALQGHGATLGKAPAHGVGRQLRAQRTAFGQGVARGVWVLLYVVRVVGAVDPRQRVQRQAVAHG